jgi:DNA mismatch endonuclease (patch repair protein)
MVDILTPDQRSAMMSRIRSKDTKPEMIVRRAAHALGYRFRLHRRDLPGRPDLVFPRLGKVIFVHGCFWHRHEGCRYSYSPKSNLAFWKKKFTRNVERDRETMKKLQKLGWIVLVIWECETVDLSTLTYRLSSFLGMDTCKSDPIQSNSL